MPDEETLDACCDVCGSLWHSTTWHGGAQRAALADEQFGEQWPAGYDPAEADRLIGRKP